jgi:DNA-binding PucR family transcriptional regulator
MTGRSRIDESAVNERTAKIVARLGARLPEVSRSIQHLLTDQIEELRGDAQVFQLLGASVEANVETMFDALQYEIPIERVEPPTAALEYARRLAQRGVPVNALVRAYRLGQQALLDIILAEIRNTDLDPGLELDVFERMIRVTSGYIDWISQQVVLVYEAERDEWLKNQNDVRAVRVRELLDASDVDVDAVAAAIRYPFHITHLALVLWFPDHESVGNELIRLERYLRGLTESMVTQGSSLFIAADRVSGWGWIPIGGVTAHGAVTHIRRFAAACKDAPYVAIGSPLPGVDGFRRSHRQAQSARTIAIASGAPAGWVVAADDPGLLAAALLGERLNEARGWVRETLGLLAADDDNDARLRDTLRIFLRAGSSYKAAARELNLHFNSVKYRVDRAIERRGRPITDDRLDVELALLICQWFGAAVLEAVASE